MCLSTHPQMMVACCPNIEIFRSYRNAMIRHLNDPSLSSACSDKAPLQDWYGTDERIALLDHLLEIAELDLPFAENEWDSFLEASIRRGKLETADLTKKYHLLKGKTYFEIFSNLLDVIGRTRNCLNRKWIGLHETWILDFYPLLARAFPDARFLVMFRDPRAIINSMLGVKNIDPEQVAQILSYVRHWRKYASLALRYSMDPQFTGRLHITAHDLILIRPQETLHAICKAFDLEFDAKMLDTRNYHNYATGTVWTGNSSFEGKTEGISSHRALRWRQKMDTDTLALIEYLCGPDLALVGYPTQTDYADPAKPANSEMIEILLKDYAGYSNWRSDLNDPLKDLGLEATRRQLLCLNRPLADKKLIRRTFLFQETYEALRSNYGPLLPALREWL